MATTTSIFLLMSDIKYNYHTITATTTSIFLLMSDIKYNYHTITATTTPKFLSRLAVILVIMFVENFKTYVIVFVDHVIVC
jgi:hypothetical protein